MLTVCTAHNFGVFEQVNIIVVQAPLLIYIAVMYQWRIICLILFFFFFSSLQDHPFIMQYNDGNTEVVSMWVCRSLEERKSQQAQRLMWTAAAPDGILG